jgi:hypothetical protein
MSDRKLASLEAALRSAEVAFMFATVEQLTSRRYNLDVARSALLHAIEGEKRE